MQAVDPYRAPSAQVADLESSAVAGINIWSAKGRLGRIRYIAYSLGLGLLLNFVVGFLSGLFGAGIGAVVLVIGMACAVFIHALLSVQRAHDFNASGWLAVLAFVPLLNLMFWFIPGSEGDNRFGPETPPNGKLAVAFACLLPALMLIGILAAVAVPAYQASLQSTPPLQAR